MIMKMRKIKMKEAGTALQTLIQKGFKVVEVGSTFLYFKNKKVFSYRWEYFDDYRKSHHIRLDEVDYEWVIELAEDRPNEYAGLANFLNNGISLTADEV